MLKLENYGEIFHNHRNCQDTNDGTCRMTTHEEPCYQKRHFAQLMDIDQRFCHQAHVVHNQANHSIKHMK